MTDQRIATPSNHCGTGARVKRAFSDGRYGRMHFRYARPDQPLLRPLLCLHMFPQSSRSLEAFVGCSARHRTVIAPDFPGYGESDPPPFPIDVEDYAAAVWELLETTGLVESHTEIDLFGVHAGAKLATKLACQQPTNIHKIVLSSAAILRDEEIRQLRQALQPIALDDEGERFNKIWRMVVRSRGPDTDYKMLATAFAEIVRNGDGYEWGHFAVFDYNNRFADDISSLSQPIALVNPGDDLYAMTPRTMKHLRRGELIDRPDWGYGYLETCAEDAARIVLDFLE